MDTRELDIKYAVVKYKIDLYSLVKSGYTIENR